MTRRFYGNLNNRLEEGRQFCDKIEVGTGVTEYYYSDRRAFEVIAVKDQKHVTIREYDHKHVGDGSIDNNWELISNPDNAEYDLTKRGDVWYYTNTITREEYDKTLASRIENDPVNGEALLNLNLVLAGFDLDKIKEKGKQTKFRKANVSFGVASYYYDYEF